MISIIFGILLLVYVYKKVTAKLRTLQGKGVKCKKPMFLFGNSFDYVTGRISFFELVKNIYETFPGKRYCGLYHMTSSAIVIRCPELIRKITVSNFDHFADRTPFILNKREPLWTRNLLNLKGEQWHRMRSILSPLFTGSKIRGMFALMSECMEQLVEYLEKIEGDVELKDVFTRVANDVIATCAFSVQVNSLRDKENEFYLMGRKVLGLSMFADTQRSFFRNLIAETLKEREAKGIVRPDMIQLLMEANRQPDITLSLDDITAQVLMFFFAGFESTSLMLCTACYELALNVDVQERLRAEVCDGNVTYESLHKMKYLDMVVSETLRKWPVGFALDRMCVSRFVIPADNENEMTVTIEKGETVLLPIVGLHRDPEYFPSPEKFEPERFSDENKHKIRPYTYMPFGMGPRNCVASRFAMLEAKVMLAHLLRKFRIVPVEKAPVSLKFSASGIFLNTDGEICLGFKQL